MLGRPSEVAGWVLAFIGFGTAIAFGVLFRRADTEGNLLRARVAESEYQAVQLRAEIEDQSMQVKRLEQQMANLDTFGSIICVTMVA